MGANNKDLCELITRGDLMTNTKRHDQVSRRNVLQTGTAVAGGGILGSYAWQRIVPSGLESASARAQEDVSFLEGFAVGPGRISQKDASRYLVARGDALVSNNGQARVPAMSTVFLCDGVIRSPEGILAFIPERLAEQGRVELKDMLVLTSARVLDLGGPLTNWRPRMNGGFIPGDEFFPEDQWYPRTRWFPTDFFVAKEGIDAVGVLVFRDHRWIPGDQWYPDEWFPEGQAPVEPTATIEAGEPLGKQIEDWPWTIGWSLFLIAADGDHFFTADSPVRKAAPFSWEELVNAKTVRPVPDFDE